MRKNNLTNALSKRIEVSQDELNPINMAYDKMFGLSNYTNEGKIIELEISSIKPHPQDPFKAYTEDKLQELADSIANLGLLEPINVKPSTEGYYEILAGKNRVNATKLNGQKSIKAIIRDVDDNTAIMIITDSNLRHREKLLPSEKGFAYRLQLETIKKQGKRTDLKQSKTSAQTVQKLSRDIVAENNNVGRDEIQRCIRLTYLSPDLLGLVDSNNIPLIAGVNLSYLDAESQKEVYQYFFVLKKRSRIDIRTSVLIKQAFNEGHKICPEKIANILNSRSIKKNSKSFSISRKKFIEYADRLPNDEELEKLFIEFLQNMFAKK